MARTGGSGVAVDDDEVVAGIELLAQTEGIFAETAGGVVTASLKRLAEAGRLVADEVTVAFITGAGLKTQEAVAGVLEPPLHVQPTISSFEEALGDRKAVASSNREVGEGDQWLSNA